MVEPGQVFSGILRAVDGRIGSRKYAGQKWVGETDQPIGHGVSLPVGLLHNRELGVVHRDASEADWADVAAACGVFSVTVRDVEVVRVIQGDDVPPGAGLRDVKKCRTEIAIRLIDPGAVQRQTREVARGEP